MLSPKGRNKAISVRYNVGMIRPKHWAHDAFATLDSILFCIVGTNTKVKYLGDRALADEHFKKHYPNIPYFKILEGKFYRFTEFPKTIALIDIENNYKLKKIR